MLPLVALIAYLSTSEVIRNAALKETIAVAGCASRCRRAVQISHSSPAGFQHRSPCGPQLQGETRVLPFCSSHWNHKRPKNYFPLFTQDLCRHVTVVCAAARRSRWLQSVAGTARLNEPSTWSPDVRSALISVGAPIELS
jgi:hypothetical protein